MSILMYISSWLYYMCQHFQASLGNIKNSLLSIHAATAAYYIDSSKYIFCLYRWFLSCRFWTSWFHKLVKKFLVFWRPNVILTKYTTLWIGKTIKLLFWFFNLSIYCCVYTGIACLCQWFLSFWLCSKLVNHLVWKICLKCLFEHQMDYF